MEKAILLCGVGGQGILLAAKVIGAAAEISGLAVTANETHGMAQRGGSVKALVKIGAAAGSPLIREGQADVIAALEPVEALRWAHFLAQGGLAVVNMRPIVPVSVTSGGAKYPDDIGERLGRVFPRLVTCDCDDAALKMGNVRLANTILVGMLSRDIPIGVDVWHEAIGRCVKPAFAEANVTAFDFGRAL